MNAIAAHKDELKNARGFEQQSGLGDDFRGVGGRVYRTSRHKLPGHKRPGESLDSGEPRSEGKYRRPETTATTNLCSDNRGRYASVRLRFFKTG